MKIYSGPCRSVHINSSGIQHQWLEQGKRLHLQHGPIDLIIEARGERSQVAVAYQAAYDTFQSVLGDLVDELVFLRTPLTVDADMPRGRVAQRMVSAARLHTQNAYLGKVTPMAAVAGAVADHILNAMLSAANLTRAYVNNGGDIALWLADGEAFTIGVCDSVENGHVRSHINLQSRHCVGGIATSGWRGRSHSLGIADAVTVLASCAADADVAATLIANAVDVPGSESIRRISAIELDMDSDLGDTPVTVAVDKLDASQVRSALDRGRLRAQQLLATGKISAVYLSLQQKTLVCGNPPQLCTDPVPGPFAGAMHA
jgi:ApbE superfamily uncharacterized protein (UPF0280 family)